MESLWNETEAAEFPDELGLRAYTSRLLGRDASLVLHGGGNTSVKLREPTLLGADGDFLYVKASGHDLASIGADGFTPLRIDHLLALARLEQLSDTEMAKELRVAARDPDKPAPSVEAILHAVLPHRYVDHTHAEAVLALTNTPSGEEHIRRAFGEQVIVVPYVMPGFELARLCAELIPAQLTDATIGLVLLSHGLVSFGETARESYERTIALVTLAENYLAEHGSPPALNATPSASVLGSELAQLRSLLSAAAGFPLVLRRDESPATLAFAQRPDVAALSQAGPATPDHAIRTKRVPLVGHDVEGFAAAYRVYFDAHAGPGLVMLDPAPRVVLDPELGLVAAGRSATEADVTAEIYRHTIDVILRATALEEWQALSPAEIFAVEYWSLEQAKLQTRGKQPEFAGEIVVVTGAASGIGAACVRAFLDRGAAVCGLDINPAVADAFTAPAYLGVACDVTSEDEIAAAFESCARRFGGVDMVVLSAGIFPASARVDALDLSEWRRVFAVNADADLLLLRAAYPFLELAPNGGRVIVVASKNVPAPGPGAAAYSASKAALTQLARVAALEWGAAGIRVNIVHPNAVFDTGIWDDEVIAARAEQYGLTPEEYRSRNVLGVEVASTDVAELAVAMCGPAFAKTTGAQVPVDGGNERVI